MDTVGPPETGKRRPRRAAAVIILCALAVVVAGAWIASVGFRAHRRYLAAEEVRKLGGLVIHDYLLDHHRAEEARGGPEFEKRRNLLDRVPLADPDPDGRAWIRRLVGPDLLHDVVRINLTYFFDESGKHTEIASGIEPVLPVLGEFRRLRELYLHDHQATDDALRAIRDLRELEVLMLWNASELTDAGVECLRDMGRLRYIHLTGSRITDRSLEILGGLPSIDGLSLQFNLFTDAGLAHLARLDRLKTLWVCAPGEASDSKAYAELLRKPEPGLPFPDRISDAGLDRLKGLGSLETLGIQNTLVTDAGLEKLRGLPKLKEVILHGARTTPAGRQALREAIPGLKTSE